MVTLVEGRSEVLADSIVAQFPEVRFEVVPNRGRDMWPFVRVLELGLVGDYDAVLKLHTKASVHRIDGDAWRDRLLDSLCPSPEGIGLILELLRRDPGVGMIAPAGAVLGREFWGSNGPMVDALAARTGIGVDPERVWFPGGSMFWSPTGAAEPAARRSAHDRGLRARGGLDRRNDRARAWSGSWERWSPTRAWPSSGRTRWPVGWRRHEHEAIQETRMQVEPLSIEGAWVFTPRIHGDERGAFLEWFKDPGFSEAVGHRLDLVQANASVSAKGVAARDPLRRRPARSGEVRDVREGLGARRHRRHPGGLADVRAVDLRAARRP